jgi:hypothetical protein
MAPEEGAIHLIKLNAVDPLAYLTNTLTAIVEGHKQSQVNKLLPWNYSGLRSGTSNK